MAKKKKTIFISDIHMGACKTDDNGKRWDWFDPKSEGPYLINFFKYLSKRSKTEDDIKELVLLGDVFDLWVCPHDIAPHNFSDIVKAQKDVIEAVKSLSYDIKIIYINGNHDFSVTSGDIDTAFGGRVFHYGNIYRRGNIHAEHGHRFAMFNCPDIKNAGASRRPLGYYLTRLHTTLGGSRKAKMLLFAQIIDELIQVAGEEKLPESVFDAVWDAACAKTGKRIEEIVIDKTGKTLGCLEIREMYKNLFNDWKKLRGYFGALKMIMCEMNRLGLTADELCRDGVDIVVFGHSHDTKMDKDTWFVKDRIYANCGYWCGFEKNKPSKDNAHFVQTDGSTVELLSFFNGKATKVTSRHL